MKNNNHKNEIVDVTIERIVPRGYGFAHAEGKTIFVSLAVPGDRLKCEIRETKGSIAFAEISEIIERSPQRIEAPCQYFGTCGGCDMQQMSYSDQLAAKVEIIKDCLRRIAKVEFDGEIQVIGSPKEFGYRSRAQWHLNAASKSIGYYKRNSRDLVAIEECPILVPELNNELRRLRNEFPWEMMWEEKGSVDATEGQDGGALNSPGVLEPEEVTYTAKGERFTYSAGVFFQGNQTLIEALLTTALDGESGGTALDLYCGVGLFALPMARNFERVIGIEENPASIEFAKRNAAANGVENVKFHTESVRKYLAGNKPRNVDLIVLDPPRAGTEKETIQNVIGLGSPRISYVACEPSVLARDLKRFDEAGYKIDSITAIDLFPQTHHVETVAKLSKR